MKAIRALFVSDLGGACAASAAAIGADPGIELVARAPDALTGAEMAAALQPDVLVLYVRAADGEAQRTVAQAAASCGAAIVTIDAGRAPAESFEALRRRVRAAASERRERPRPAPARPVSGAGCGARLIAIGASTGGVEALVQLLSAFPRTCPPTVVVQHMPPFFTTSFAARLDAVCAPTVHEAWDGAPLERGVIYLAPGGPAHLEVCWASARKVRLTPTEPVNRHRPSVDVCFFSVARQLGSGAIGVLLTGMGRDGAEGLLAMRAAGARTLAQDRDTSTVYGMPRAALEIGAVDRGTPLGLIADAIFSSEAPQKEAV